MFPFKKNLTVELVGFGAMTSEDGKLGAIVIDGSKGEHIEAHFPRENIPGMAGTLLKAAADDVARESRSALAAGSVAKNQTHIPLKIEAAAGKGGKVLMFSTTDKTVLKILLVDSQIQQIIAALTSDS